MGGKLSGADGESDSSVWGGRGGEFEGQEDFDGEGRDVRPGSAQRVGGLDAIVRRCGAENEEASMNNSNLRAL